MVNMEDSLKQVTNKKHSTNYLMLWFCIIVFASVCGCKHNYKPATPDKEPFFTPTDMEIIWIRPIHSDTMGEYMGIPLLTDKYVIFTNSENPDNTIPPGIGVYDKLTGKNHPAWQKEFGTQINEDITLQDEHLAGVNNNILIVHSWFRVFAFDIASGKKLWDKDLEIGPQSSVNFTNFYAIVDKSKTLQTMSKIEATTGRVTSIINHKYENDEFTMLGMNPPAAYTNAHGDTLLYYTIGDWAPDVYEGRVWACCYNASKKEMVWKNQNFTNDKDACGEIAPPILYENDKIIIHTLRGVHCLNAYTGELIWGKTYYTNFLPDGSGGTSESLASNRIVLHNDRIYARSHVGTIYCLDAHTGNEIWKNDQLFDRHSGRGSIIIHNHYVYIAGSDYKNGLYFSGITCLDMYTGKEIWRDAGPCNGIEAPLALDEQTGYLYCSSLNYVMCIDLNKTEENMQKKAIK